MKTSSSKTAAKLLVECLENEGVQYIFGLPGEENLAVMEALKDSKIKFILTRHEQGAAFMADVYGRLTGKAGVCLATLGPGATNLVTGVADANSDGAPLVAITGQVGTERMHITSHQFLDLTKIFEPITKRTKLVLRPDTINEIVRLAFKYAQGERPGATHIDLPVDIAKLPAPEHEAPLLKVVESNIGKAELTSIEKAAGEIFQAKCPVILAGNEAIRKNSAKAITKFAESLHIPVINSMMAKGVIPADSSCYLMTIGIPNRDYANLILEKADLVIAIGYDIVEYAPIKWNKNPRHKIIHVSNSQAHINKYYQCAVQVVGDIADSLAKIANRSAVRELPQELFAIKEKFLQTYHEDIAVDQFPLKPQRAIAAVRKILGREDILLSDVGAHKMWIARHYDCYKPNTCIISNGFATMGIGLPGAIAAKLVHPEKKVLTITGDGGFMMNAQELETAARLKLNIVILIFNDSGYGLIRWKQMDQYHETCFVDFDNIDYVKLAEAMNCIGYKIDRAEDLLPTLESSFTKNVPVVIDLPIDYSENEKLSQYLKNI